MQKYTKLYAWVRKVFGKKAFTLRDFTRAFWTNNERKVIYDLVERGCLIRVERGKYMTVDPEKWVSGMVDSERNKSGMEIIDESSRKYAFSDHTSLLIWTDGYYKAGTKQGFIPRQVKVRKKDLDYWKSFFRERKISWVLKKNKESKTLFGITYVLHPEKEFRTEEKNGLNVIPLKKAVEYAKRLNLGPALEELDRKYDINYKKRESLPYA